MLPNNHAAELAEIVKSALELSSEDRQSFLEEHCRSNPELRAEVESLLKHEQRANNLIETPALHLAAETLVRESSLHAGQIIGDYEIISLIGSGGMGEVYLAQDRQLHRRAALKLIRRGMDTHDIVRRFRHEERLLASLNHPNIAQLYGGGVTVGDVPFFAMEYVEGQRLDHYCKDRQLPIDARLQLFRKVCAAVSYAHQHLVIHRDIKPANIRVTPEGEPKLLDFGIAKLLDTSGAPEMTITLPGVMTPEYASPEQVRGESVTTASDIYSLGVVLYELLTGQKPYKIDSRTPMEAARVITEQEPTKPSTAAAKGGGNSKIEIRKSKILKGDLDNVVLMAMRKEPQRRYASVAQFSDDIARYLDGRPVLAHKDSLGYRAGKFIRRNKIAVAAAALIMFSFILGLAAFAWEAKIAAAQRDQARHEKTNAERAYNFLQSALLTPDPSWYAPGSTRGREVTFDQLLETAGTRARKELADEPAMLAGVLRTIGNTYRAQGRYEQAEQNLREAANQFARADGAQPLDLITTDYNLAQTLLLAGKYAEAEPLFRHAVIFYREEAKRGDNTKLATLAGTLNDLAYLLRNKGQPRAAEELLRQALEISPRLRAPFEILRPIHLSHLAYTRDDQGDLEGAEKIEREAIEGFHALSAMNRMEAGNALVALGSILKTKGDYAAAEMSIQQALEIYRRLVGDSHPNGALALNQQAHILFLKGDCAKAEPLAQKAITIQKEQLPPAHPSGAYSLTTLGLILTKTNRANEAEPILRDALARREKVLPQNHWLLAETRAALGECLAAQKNFNEAELLLSSACEATKNEMGLHHPRTIEMLKRVVQFYENWGKPEVAANYRALLRR